MADIDVVPKKRGTSWVVWVVVALLAAVLVWMLLGRNDEPRQVRHADPAPSVGPVSVLAVTDGMIPVV